MRSFYDEMADDYHLIFRDWDVSMEYQASVLSAVIEAGTDEALQLSDKPALARRFKDLAYGQA